MIICFALILIQLIFSLGIPTPKSKSTVIGQEQKSELEINKSKLQVTVTEIETEYHIEKNYEASVPNIHVSCECNCGEEIGKCSENALNMVCARLKDPTTYCIPYSHRDKNIPGCSDHYNFCCQVYFNKYTAIGKHIALKLKYFKTFYKFRVQISDEILEISKNFDLTIADKMNGIILSSDILLEVPVIPSSILIPEGWYLTLDKILELLTTSQINDESTCDFQKIGWFRQNGDKTFKCAHINEVKKNLKVIPIECDSEMDTSSKYTWTFNGTHYYQNGTLRFPLDLKKVTERYKNVSKVSLNLHEKKALVKGNINPNITVLLASGNSFKHEWDFLFTAKIATVQNNRLLFLNFIKGMNNFNVEIAPPHWNQLQSFKIKVTNCSLEQPFLYNHTVEIQTKLPLWVCVYQQDFKKLCQFISHSAPSINSPSQNMRSESGESSLNSTGCSSTNVTSKLLEASLFSKHNSPSFLPYIITFVAGLVFAVVFQMVRKWWFRRILQKKNSSRTLKRSETDSKNTNFHEINPLTKTNS